MTLEQFYFEESELRKDRKLIEWSEKPYKCIRCKFELEAINDTNIHLYNLSIPHAMLYYIIEEIDYKLSYTLHQNKNIKPWSFSYLLPQDKYKKVSSDGYYFIPKGTTCLWFLNTLSPKVANAFISAQKRSLPLCFGNLQLKMNKMKIEDNSYYTPPEDQSFKFIDVKLHTPTYFYLKKENKLLEFEMEHLISFQLNKLKYLRIVNTFDEKELKPRIRIFRDYTQTKSCVISSYGKQSGTKNMFGQYGKFTAKINGSEEDKRNIWEVFHLSQFLGIGSKGSMGFGHNTLLKTY
jgi:CRISPR-associated endoribonuclease Cas6